MVHIRKKDKGKLLETIYPGKTDIEELPLPSLAGSIVLVIEHHGFSGLLNNVFANKRKDNLHITRIYS